MNKQPDRTDERLERLYHFSRLINSPLGSKQRLRLIIDEAIRITGASSGSLLIMEPGNDYLSIEVLRGYSTRSIRRHLRMGEGITGWVAKTGKPALVSDVSRDRRYLKFDPRIRSELAVPIILKGRVIGIINVNGNRVGAFDRSDLELLTTFASHSAQIIENDRLYREGLQRAGEIKLLFEVGKTLSENLELDTAFRQVVAGAARLLKSRVVSLMLLTPDRMELELKAVFGGGPGYIGRPNLTVASSFVGKVVRTRKPVTSIDVREEKGYLYLDLARQEGLCSLLSVPLLARGEVIGVLNAYKSTRTEFGPAEVRMLVSLADLAAVAIDKAHLYQQTIDLEKRILRIEKLGVMGELAREFAHEIRNPLTIVKMLVYSLSGDENDRKVIMEEIDRMNRITGRFLHLGKPAPEDRPLQVDLNRLLLMTLELLNHRIGRQGIKVHNHLKDIPLVQADPDRMEQLFLNLFLNAMDAMEPGGRITLASGVEEGKVEISIADTGPGIPKEDWERIFQPFVTTKEGGTGLGLTISRRIAEEHGGGIRVHSRPGRGATFTVFLPVGG